MAATILVKMNDVSFEDLTDPQVTPGTKISKGAFVRQIEIYKIAIDNVERIIDQKSLKHKIAVANMIAYPNQKDNSHNLWAGKVISGWKKAGIIEVVEIVEATTDNKYSTLFKED